MTEAARLRDQAARALALTGEVLAVTDADGNVTQIVSRHHPIVEEFLVEADAVAWHVTDGPSVEAYLHEPTYHYEVHLLGHLLVFVFDPGYW